MEHQILAIVAYASAVPRQRVAIRVKLVVLELANAELPQLVSVRQLEPIAMLQITYVNVRQV